VRTESDFSVRRNQAGQQPLTELLDRRGALQFPGDPRHVGLHPPLLVHRGGALLEQVDRARKTACFIRSRGKRHRLAVFAGGDRLDRAFERLNGIDDPAKCQKAEESSQEQGRRVGDEHLALERFDTGCRILTGKGRRVLVVGDPVVGHAAQPHTDVGDTLIDQIASLVPPSLIVQRHDLLRAGNPFAAEGLIVIDQPAPAVVEDQTVCILLQQPVHITFVFVESRPGLGSLRFAGRKQMVADVDPQLGEAAGQIAQRGERCDA
jgi:hypothetical protein